ncbi:MAG TPA: hypothetical protein VGN88_07620 [Phycisphaerae bacterium]|jgi:hypothetical protein
MRLPADIEILATASMDGLRFHLTPPDMPLAETDLLAAPSPLAAICLRLAATLLAKVSEPARSSSGIILGTRHGCLRTDIDFDQSRREAAGRFASPGAFRGTLPSAIPSELSVRLGTKGPILVVLEDADFIALALSRAFVWMRRFPMEYCIAGGFDWPPDFAPQGTFHLLRFKGINGSS